MLEVFILLFFKQGLGFNVFFIFFRGLGFKGAGA